MREQESTPPPTVSYEDVSDALSLAFFEVELADCAIEDLPVIKTDDDVTWSAPKIRRKESYDPARGCFVVVTHFTYERQYRTARDQAKYLMVEWDDAEESNVIVRLDIPYIGTYPYVDGEYGDVQEFTGEDFDRTRTQAKLALAAVTSII